MEDDGGKMLNDGDHGNQEINWLSHVYRDWW